MACATCGTELRPAAKFCDECGSPTTASPNVRSIARAIVADCSTSAIEAEYASGEMVVRAAAVAALVEALLRRGDHTDLQEAQAAIDRLAAVPTEPGFVVNEIWLLRMRALEARARGDELAYRDYRDRYRAMANSLGFEGHIKWASEMGAMD